MRISNRLEALTFFVPYNSKVIDVGTDHALLPIYLIENDLVCNPIIASDNKYGPLETAKKNIAMYDLQSKISLCLSDGLKEVESDFDCVIIAGMGGSLISKILNDSKEKLEKVKTLILQPNNSEYAVREFLKNNNFKITNEMIVYEDDHYYTIIVAEHGENDYDERRKVTEGLENLGIEIDVEKNKVKGKQVDITGPNSKIKVFVIPTNEELMIAKETMALVTK